MSNLKLCPSCERYRSHNGRMMKSKNFETMFHVHSAIIIGILRILISSFISPWKNEVLITWFVSLSRNGRNAETSDTSSKSNLRLSPNSIESWKKIIWSENTVDINRSLSTKGDWPFYSLDTFVFPSVFTILGAAPHTKHATLSKLNGVIILARIPVKLNKCDEKHSD